jgi:succinate dehydrogenase / fumarate reductase flavoprotein subunit
VSEAITRSALDRKESRGAHFREDYPSRDEAAGRVNTVVRKGADGEMQLVRQPLPEPPPELKAIIEEFK